MLMDVDRDWRTEMFARSRRVTTTGSMSAETYRSNDKRLATGSAPLGSAIHCRNGKLTPIAEPRFCLLSNMALYVIHCFE